MKKHYYYKIEWMVSLLSYFIIKKRIKEKIKIISILKDNWFNIVNLLSSKSFKLIKDKRKNGKIWERKIKNQDK